MMTEQTNKPNDEAIDDNAKVAVVKENVKQTGIAVNTFNAGSLNSLNLFDEKQLASAINFLDKVMRTDKGGFKTVNEGLAVLMRAKDLDIPFSSSLEHIHVINGKTGVDIHIIKALLLRAGVTWRCTKNYTPLYEYTDGINVYVDNLLPDYVEKCKSRKEAEEKQANSKDNKDVVFIYPVQFYSDIKKVVYKSYQLDGRFAIAVTKTDIDAIIKAGKMPVYRIPNQPVDYITEYEFTRTVNDRTITAVSSFSYSEAMTAGMFDKDTYKKYPKVLIGHRAFTYGARDIASDAIMGCMETTELKIISGKELNDAEIADFEEVK